MKHKQAIQSGLLVLFGFIVGFAAHAYLAGEIADDVAENDEITEEVAESEETPIAAEKDGESEELAEESTPVTSHDAGLNRLAYGDVSIMVKDQASGSSVFLTEVALDDTLWVAVRESAGSELGSILGARKYSSDATSGVVDLLRGTEPGSVYHVVLYSEDGDGEFDHKKDSIVTNGDGQVVTAQFLTH